MSDSEQQRKDSASERRTLALKGIGRAPVYRKGKAPVAAPGEINATSSASAAFVHHRRRAEPKIVKAKPLLLQKTEQIEEQEQDRAVYEDAELPVFSKVEIEKPVVVEHDSDEQEEELRRARIRARKLQMMQEEEEEEENDNVEIDQDEDEEEAEESLAKLVKRQGSAKSLREEIIERKKTADTAGHSDEESDDEDENQVSSITMLKPVFISRDSRRTIEEREKIEEMELAEIEMRRMREEERQEQSKSLVLETLEREQNALEKLKLKNESDQELPDDEDISEEDEEEFNAWKIRELQRLQRDHEIRLEEEALENEKQERAKMTDSQIEAENSRLGLKKSIREKGTMKFMQKYYHGGAFFHDGDLVDKELVSRDITVATGQDRSVDRSILPKILQVRDYGKKGRTKYTHLTDQDTSSFQSNPWVQGERMRYGDRAKSDEKVDSSSAPAKKKNKP